MPMRITLLLTILGLGCLNVGAQVPLKKDNLTVSDREEWRRILKWADGYERCFQAYQQYSPPGGLLFNKLRANEYFISVGCAGSVAVFVYYRENSPPRLLKFKEYDAAHNVGASAYSNVNFIMHGFDPDGNVLWIYSFGAGKNVCLMHKYRETRGRPLLLRSRRLRCTDVL